MGESFPIHYILMFLPVGVAFIIILYIKFHERHEPPQTYEEEISVLEKKSENLASEIKEGREKISELKKELHGDKEVQTHEAEVSELDKEIEANQKALNEYTDNAPECDKPLENVEQAADYLGSFKKNLEPKIPGLMILIFIFVSSVVWGARPVNAGDSVTVTSPSVILTLDEAENIRSTVQSLKESNRLLASQTFLLKNKIELMGRDLDSYKYQNTIQGEDLEVYKKLTNEYELTLKKFTEQVTALEDALTLSKRDTEVLKKENSYLNRKSKRNEILGYLMFGIGVWLGSR